MLQADGGTRTASVTGAYIAMYDALATWREAGKIAEIPVSEFVAATSVGMVDGVNMLDLDFDPISKYYEAPAQVKATGGVFIVDDFGRQLVQPKDLLNRWIVPLEKRVDYLTVHTGMKFEIPFDQLVIFSTNIPPYELMDAAQLRRVKYKLRIDPPQFSEYKDISQGVRGAHAGHA